MKKYGIGLICFLLFFFVVAVSNVKASTTIPGGTITTDTVWAKDASPYIIDGNVEVESDATLSIQPGVVVKFGRDAYGANYYLWVKGNFAVNGLPADRVIFTTIEDDLSGADYDGNWLTLIQSSDNTNISNAVFSNFYYLSFYGTPNVTLESIGVRNASGGVSFSGVNSATIENSRFSNLRYDGIMSDSGNLSVRNSIIENMQDGIAVQSNGNLEIINSQIKGVTEGTAVSANSGSTIIQNSIFKNGTGSTGLLFSKTNVMIASSSVSGFDYGGIYVSGGKFSADHITVSNNSEGGIALEDASGGPGPMVLMSQVSGDQDAPLGSTLESASISQSRIFRNGGFGLQNNSGITADAKNNWWGDSSGPKNISSNQAGLGDEIMGNIDFVPWLENDPWEVQSEPDPVIIIPGIAGTELYNGNDLIWPDLGQMFIDINDQFLTENLDLSEQGESLNNINLGNTIKKISALLIFNQNIFEDLQQNLELNGYQENQNLFFFPYDWRLDLNTTKESLNQKIEEVKVQTGTQKVNIIAHSMGGLLTKEYLNSYGKESVDKLIFVGTPHLGAPKAGKILLEGDRFSIPWLEEDRIKDIAQNSPALHELLPNQTYFTEFQGYFRKYSLFSINPLMNYAETKNFFLNDRNENPVMFQKAENFYNKNLDNLNFNGIETYNIAGCKTPTQAAYSFGVFNEIGQTGYTSGDGTVPMVSADYINITNTNKFYVKDGSHAELPSANGVRDLILEILNGNVNSPAGNVSNDPSFCSFKGKKLTWRSPVEIHIYSGRNHTGPIENNAIEYGIPGIDYDVMGHNKFIFLPTDNAQEYLVEAKGLEEGSFDLNISEVDNGQYLTTQVFNDVPVTTSAVASFVVNNLENHSLELKDEEITKEVQVDAILNGETILDLTPPETTAKIDWIKDKKQKKKMQITLIVTDNQSGILETAYSLDEGDTFNIYSKPIIVEKKIDEIFFYSIDKAGNNEEVKEFDLEKNKPNKCKSWKCLEINKKHDKIKKEYKEIKGYEQEFISKFKNLKLGHK